MLKFNEFLELMEGKKRADQLHAGDMLILGTKTADGSLRKVKVQNVSQSADGIHVNVGGEILDTMVFRPDQMVKVESIGESDADDLYFKVKNIIREAPEGHGFEVYIHPVEGKIFLSAGDWSEEKETDELMKKLKNLNYPVELEFEAGPGKGWEKVTREGKRVKV